MLLAALLAMATVPAWPRHGGVERDHDHDHDRAREAVAGGEVLPLRQVLERLAREQPGARVLDVELEPKHGRWIYEIRLLQPGGRLHKLRLDARTGQPLRPDDDAGHDDHPRHERHWR